MTRRGIGLGSDQPELRHKFFQLGIVEALKAGLDGLFGQVGVLELPVGQVECGLDAVDEFGTFAGNGAVFVRVGEGLWGDGQTQELTKRFPAGLIDEVPFQQIVRAFGEIAPDFVVMAVVNRAEDRFIESGGAVAFQDALFDVGGIGQGGGGKPTAATVQPGVAAAGGEDEFGAGAAAIQLGVDQRDGHVGKTVELVQGNFVGEIVAGAEP